MKGSDYVLQWVFDEDEKEWWAFSLTHDDGDNFSWRVRESGSGHFVIDSSDGELLVDGASGMGFREADDAKLFCQVCEERFNYSDCYYFVDSAITNLYGKACLFYVVSEFANENAFSVKKIDCWPDGLGFNLDVNQLIEEAERLPAQEIQDFVLSVGSKKCLSLASQYDLHNLKAFLSLLNDDDFRNKIAD